MQKILLYILIIFHIENHYRLEDAHLQQSVSRYIASQFSEHFEIQPFNPIN